MRLWALLPILYLGLTPSRLAAQETAPPSAEEEAPEALFGFQLGDREVELDLKGWWNLGLSLGLGAAVDEAGWWGGWYPAEVAPGFQFFQQPNLEFQLWIDRRWLAQATYTSGAAGNAFLLGYRGRPAEWLEFVHLGTYPLTIRSAAHTAVLPNRQGAPAANLGLRFPDWWSQFLVQYEGRTEQVRRFVGTREATARSVAVHEWIRLRFFRLPPGPWPGLQFLAESQGTYRTVQPGEVVVDTFTGLVEIPQRRAHAYLVRWTGMAVGNDPITGQPLPTQTVGADTWMVLCRGEAYAPLELKNRYALTHDEVAAELEVGFTDRGLPRDPRPDIAAVVQREARVLVLEGTAVVGKDYPFFDLVPRLYEPGGQSLVAAQNVGIEIVSVRRPEGFFLGTEVQPDSIRVWRNGQPFGSFRFDQRSGRLEILDPVLPADRFEVRFLERRLEGGAPRLFIWQTGQWDLGPGWNLQSAVGLAWPFERSAFTTEDGQAPGYGLGRLLLQSPGKELSWELEAEGQLSVPDATGERLWFAAGQEPTLLSLETEALRPGSLPPQDSAWGTNNPGNLVPLTPTNRGRLRYRDFFERDTFGNLFLRPWGAPGVTVEPYGDQGRTGPYLALAGGGEPGRSAVLEYELEPSRRWVSAQLFVANGETADWSRVRTLRFRQRLETTTPGVSVYLLVGTLGEDPDGQNQVRPAQFLGGVPSLPWKDPVDGFELSFPIPAGAASSTAWRGRTWYQPPVSTQVVARLLPSPTSSWSTVEIALGPEEARALERTNSLQIVVVSNTPTSQTGVYQIAGPSWEGTASGAEPIPPATQAPRVWQDAESLRIDAPQGPFRTRTRPRPLTFQHYRVVRFPFRLTAGANPSQLRMSALDARGRGLVWTVSLTPQAAWREVELDWNAATARVDGVVAGQLSVDRDAGPLVEVVLEYWDSAPLQATLGDLRARDALAQVEGAARGLWRWQSSTHTLEGEVRATTRGEWWWRQLWAQRFGPLDSRIQTRLGQSGEWRFSAEYREELRWPALWLGDAFQDTAERRHWLGVNLPGLGSLTGSATLSWTPWSTRQVFEAESRDLAQDILPVTPLLRVRWEQGVPTAPPSGNILDVWWWSTRALYDWAPPGLDRRLATVTGRLTLGLASGETWLEASGEGEQRPLDATTQDRTYRLEAGLRHGVSVGDLPGEGRLTLSRQLRRSQASLGWLTGQDFLSRWASALSNDLSALLLPPGVELWTEPEDFWSTLAHNARQSYQGRVQGGLQRAPLLGRLDVLIPLAVQAEWQTVQGHVGTPQPASEAAVVQVHWLSVNQFGSRAAEPLLDWYAQDEIGSLLRWEWKRHPPLEPTASWNLLQHMVVGTDSWRFRIEHQWSHLGSSGWSWRGAWKARWEVPVDLPLQVPYMRTPRDFQERLILELAAETTWTSALLPFLPLQRVSLGPTVEWRFHPNGSLLCRLFQALERQATRAVVGTELRTELRLSF